jgi:hydroxyacylglutathione hydrolase
MPRELIHEILPVGLLQCNCSILGDPETHEAIVVDPGDDVDRILAILRKHELRTRAIVSTHTHIDHVGGLALLHRATGAPVLIHPDDLDLYGRLDAQARWIGLPAPETTRIEDFLREGDTLRWGDFVARVLHTPGHTPGSICLVVDSASAPANLNSQPDSENIAAASQRAGARERHDSRSHALRSGTPAARLISGDTLFQGSIGRTDLWGGSYPQIINSIREKLIVLPEEIPVYPGHGGATTIGHEREYNPFLR